jgi:S1-C subfamily serine protease
MMKRIKKSIVVVGASAMCLISLGQSTTGSTSVENGVAMIQNEHGTLELRTGKDSRVVVSKSTPESYWSFSPGDIITEVDGKPIRTPEEFFEILRSTNQRTITCIVMRKDAEVSVVSDVERYRNAMPPRPPTPPSRPSK